jgi:hypothetical protein
LLAVTTGQQVVDLIHDQHPRRNPAQQVASKSLKRGQAGRRAVRRAEFEEQSGVEAMLIRRSRHLHGNDLSPLHTLELIEGARMLTAQFRDDQRLADVGVAMQCHAWHPLALGGVQQAFQSLKRLRGTGIVDPSVALQ